MRENKIKTIKITLQVLGVKSVLRMLNFHSTYLNVRVVGYDERPIKIENHCISFASYSGSKKQAELRG